MESIAQDERRKPPRRREHVAIAIFLLVIVSIGVFSWYWPRYASSHTRQCADYPLYPEATKQDRPFQPNDLVYAFYSDGSAGAAYGLFDWSSGRSNYRPHNITVSPRQIYMGTLTLSQGEYYLPMYAENQPWHMFQGDTVSGLYYAQEGLYVDQKGRPITSYTVFVCAVAT